jgi:hypothetical protein
VQRTRDVARHDRVIYGHLVSRVAKERVDADTAALSWDVSMALALAAPALAEEAAKPNMDFASLVRARRKGWGLPVPPCEQSARDRLLSMRT